jgi:cytochrome c biogenesis protein CcmG, thiol:disulfide interchange protein DsbE
MSSAEQTARTQQRTALLVVILGIAAVAAVMWWEHASQPSGSSAITHVNVPTTGSSAELDPLYAALGMRRPTEPAAAPDFTLLSLDGQPAQLREFRGKLVLLNFWATWCAPCLHEMPSMERLYQTFKQTDFVLLAVSMDRQGEAVAKPFADNLKLTFPILLDNTSEVSRQYSVRGLPTTYLIDPDGLLIGVVIGARDWYKAEAKALIAGLLRRIPPPSDQAEPELKKRLPGPAGTQEY